MIFAFYNINFNEKPFPVIISHSGMRFVKEETQFFTKLTKPVPQATPVFATVTVTNFPIKEVIQGKFQ